MSGSPPQSRRAFGSPMRVDIPAARTMLEIMRFPLCPESSAGPDWGRTGFAFSLPSRGCPWARVQGGHGNDSGRVGPGNELASFEHVAHTAERGEVERWVAFDDDEVGQLARC